MSDNIKTQAPFTNSLWVKAKCSQSPPRLYMGHNHHPVLWSCLFSFPSVQATRAACCFSSMSRTLCVKVFVWCIGMLLPDIHVVGPVFPLIREAFPGHPILPPFLGHPILYPFYPSYPRPLSPLTFFYDNTHHFTLCIYSFVHQSKLLLECRLHQDRWWFFDPCLCCQPPGQCLIYRSSITISWMKEEQHSSSVASHMSPSY